MPAPRPPSLAPLCRRQCELDNATLHRDLSAALEKILNHKLAVQVGRCWAGCLPAGGKTGSLVLPL